MKARWMIVPLGLAMLLPQKDLQPRTTDAKEKKFEATCPVSGKPAGEDHMVERKNGGVAEKVYFCCEKCPKAFRSRSQEICAQHVNRQLLETGQIVQVACPLTGKPVNKEAKA